MRSMAFLLIAAQLAPAFASGSARAYASDACWTAEETATGSTCSPAIVTLLEDYLSAHSSVGTAEFSRLKRDVMVKRIVDHVFAEPGSFQYVSDLGTIDQYSSAYPEAVFDLARSLQRRWELRYGSGLGRRHSKRVKAGTQVGAMAMTAMLGITLIKKPQNTGRYFQMVRSVFPAAPLAGGLAGAATADLASGMLDANVPVSPAHVMTLGVDTNVGLQEDDHYVREFAATTAGFAAGGFAYDIVNATRHLNKAATPAKWNPMALIGSFAVGYVVEGKVKAELDRRQHKKLSDGVVSAVASIEKARKRGDVAGIYAGATELVERVFGLTAYLNLPVSEASVEFANLAAAAEKKHGKGSAAAEKAIAEATAALTKRIQAIQDSHGNPYFWDHEAQLLVDYLENEGFEGVSRLSGSAKSRAEFLLKGFEKELRFAERRKGAGLTAQERDAKLASFLDGMARAKNAQLAREFIAGDWRRDGNNVVLQAAAYLRTLEVEFFELMVDDLMALIPEYQLAVSVSGEGDYL